jgi:hypothetical protein
MEAVRCAGDDRCLWGNCPKCGYVRLNAYDFSKSSGKGVYDD